MVHGDGLTTLPYNAQKVQATELSWRLRGKFCTTRCTANITSRNDTQAFIQACGWAKTQHSGDHIVATRTTVVKARSIRRYIYNERVEIDHLLSLNSVPWNEQGDGTFDPTFVTSWDLSQGMHTSDQYHDDQHLHHYRMSLPSNKGGITTST